MLKIDKELIKLNNVDDKIHYHPIPTTVLIWEITDYATLVHSSNKFSSSVNVLQHEGNSPQL